MKKIKKSLRHSKIKNTGILFELLSGKLTSDILSGRDLSDAQRIIETFFNGKSELSKEYLLYQTLYSNKFNSTEKAKDFIDEVLKAENSINHSKLNKEKYNLIKEIKSTFDMDDFFKAKIENYKLLASIYKLFNHNESNYIYSPDEIVNAKYTIIENITNIKEKNSKVDEEDEVLNSYINENKELRLLTYKIMIDKFNETYSELDNNQKNVIREYINNLSSANSLVDYITKQIPKINETISDLLKKVCDKTTKIKVNEVVRQLNLLKDLKTVNDNHVVVILSSYELIKELSKLEQVNEK